METPKLCEICLKVTIKNTRVTFWQVFINSFDHIPHHCCGVSIVDFEQVNAGCEDWSCMDLSKVARGGSRLFNGLSDVENSIK